MSSAHEAIGPQFETSPLHKSDLGNAPGAATSREVSPDEYQALAGQGKQYLAGLAGQKNGHAGLEKHWGEISEGAQAAVKEPWGGATYSGKTGKAMSPGANSYAISAREPGQRQISIPTNSKPEEFQAAMSKARDTMPAHATHLGVFHDADKGTIDVDPAVVVNSRQKVDQVGAYTKAAGGAYHMRSGKGFYPPHTAEGDS